MNLRRVPAPTGDPFWDALLSRRPEAELLLLPPEESERLEPSDAHAAAGPAEDRFVDEAREVVRLLVDDTVDRLGLADAPPTGSLDRLRAGRQRGSVIAEVRRVLPLPRSEEQPDGATHAHGALAATLADALRVDGWDVTHRPGTVDRVVADRAGRAGLPGMMLAATFSGRSAAVSVEAESDDLLLVEGHDRELLRADRARRAEVR